MGEFFKGWRRKIGVVTLVMACVITSLWIGSRGISNTYAIPLPADRALVVTSLNGRIGCGVEVWISPPIASANNGKFHESLLDYTLEEWHYLPCTVPCWTIAVPLTLISLWLLLSKPYKSTRTKTIIPIQDEKGGATS